VIRQQQARPRRWQMRFKALPRRVYQMPNRRSAFDPVFLGPHGRGPTARNSLQSPGRPDVRPATTAMVRIDMSEYMGEARCEAPDRGPPGYVG